MNYKIGTTSYIYPENVLYNIKKLKDEVDDIELLFFEQGYSIDKSELNEIKRIRDSYGLSYTVHLPLDLQLGDSDKGIRERSVNEVKRIINQVLILEPEAYICHINRSGFDNICLEKNSREAMENIIESFSLKPEKICLENLDYPLELLDGIVGDLGLSICLDIGHLMKYGYSVEKYISKYINKSRVLHLYGVQDDGCHGSLNKMNTELMEWIKRYLKSSEYDGVVTLEVFSEQDLNESIELISRSILKPV